MSTKNKALDRDNAGRIKRAYKSRHVFNYYSNWDMCPKWWRKLHMTRPRRRLNRHLCREVLSGRDAEGIAWPLGNSKPHVWYW